MADGCLRAEKNRELQGLPNAVQMSIRKLRVLRLGTA